MNASAVGIDVAESHKGLDLVALGPDRAIVCVHDRLTVAEAITPTRDLAPSLVGIDSPSGCSLAGRLRPREIPTRAFRTEVLERAGVALRRSARPM